MLVLCYARYFCWLRISYVYAHRDEETLIATASASKDDLNM